MDKPLVPLCRLYQNASKRTGKPYLTGNLSYTTKCVGFESTDENGNSCWQLYLQERPPKSPAGQPPPPRDTPQRRAEQQDGESVEEKETYGECT